MRTLAARFLERGEGATLERRARLRCWRARCGNVFPRGFTLVELLVVITIIGLLIALLLPAVQAAREAARKAQCSNNLKQIGLATLGYEQTHGMLPAGGYQYDASGNSYRRGSIWIRLLPYLEQQPLYDQFDFNGNTDAQKYPNSSKYLGATVLPVYICPSDQPTTMYTRCASGYAKSNYAASAGPFAVGGNTSIPCSLSTSFNAYANTKEKPVPGPFHRIGGWQCRLNEIVDGLSNTIFFGEIRPYCDSDACGWHCSCSGSGSTSTVVPINYYSGDTYDSSKENACSSFRNQTTEFGFKSCHPGGAFFGLGDGTVRFLSEIIDPWVYSYLGDKNGGKAFSPPW